MVSPEPQLFHFQVTSSTAQAKHCQNTEKSDWNQSWITNGEKLTFECILLHGSADVFHDITFWFDDDFPQRADHGGSDDFRTGPGVVEGGAKGPYHVRLLLASGQLRAHQVVGHVLKRTPHLDQGLVDVVNDLEDGRLDVAILFDHDFCQVCPHVFWHCNENGLVKKLRNFDVTPQPIFRFRFKYSFLMEETF